jgi:hypothetical protein
MSRELIPGTTWCAATKVIFVESVRRCLCPSLRRRDVVVLDHLQAHKDPGGPPFIIAVSGLAHAGYVN